MNETNLQIYISYCSNDNYEFIKQIVSRIKLELNSNLIVCINNSLNKNSDIWYKECFESIGKSFIFICFCSTSYLLDEFCIRQMEYALSLSKKSMIQIITILMDETKINLNETIKTFDIYCLEPLIYDYLKSIIFKVPIELNTNKLSIITKVIEKLNKKIPKNSNYYEHLVTKLFTNDLVFDQLVLGNHVNSTESKRILEFCSEVKHKCFESINDTNPALKLKLLNIIKCIYSYEIEVNSSRNEHLLMLLKLNLKIELIKEQLSLLNSLAHSKKTNTNLWRLEVKCLSNQLRESLHQKNNLFKQKILYKLFLETTERRYEFNIDILSVILYGSKANSPILRLNTKELKENNEFYFKLDDIGDLVALRISHEIKSWLKFNEKIWFLGNISIETDHKRYSFPQVYFNYFHNVLNPQISIDLKPLNVEEKFFSTRQESVLEMVIYEIELQTGNFINNRSKLAKLAIQIVGSDRKTDLIELSEENSLYRLSPFDRAENKFVIEGNDIGDFERVYLSQEINDTIGLFLYNFSIKSISKSCIKKNSLKCNCWLKNDEPLSNYSQNEFKLDSAKQINLEKVIYYISLQCEKEIDRKLIQTKKLQIRFKGDKEISNEKMLENPYFKENCVFFMVDDYYVGLLEEIEFFSNMNSNDLILKNISVDLPQKNQYFISDERRLSFKNKLVSIKMIQIEQIKESTIH